MTHSPRVALMGMILESNRFAKPATLLDFQSLNWLQGDELLTEARSDTPSLAKEFSAFVQTMDATGDWTPVPLLLAACRPNGPVEEQVFDAYSEAMLAGLAEPVDAIYLCHHGAMVATHLDDPDGELVTRIRKRVGAKVPIVLTLDLHANISDSMTGSVDVVCGYRTNPHVDQIERGEEAAFTLRRILAGLAAPRVAHVKLPLAPASISLLTASGPYGELMDYGQKRQAEMGGVILNVSIFGNFIFSDVPENGLSVVVTARENLAAAEALATEIAAMAWEMRTRFVRTLTTIDEAVSIASTANRCPVIFSEAGDNPGGGGSGRTTEFLAALINAQVADVLYGSFFDVELADEAHQLGAGATFTARFNRSAGSNTWEQWDKPLTVEAKVVALTDGEVTGRLGLFAGRRLKLGRCALLQIGGIKVVIISDRAQTADPILFEMFDIDIADARTVVVKSRGHFRAGFLPWFNPEQVYEIDTEGLTSPVLQRWPLKRVPRPSFPLDPETQWSSNGSGGDPGAISRELV